MWVRLHRVPRSRLFVPGEQLQGGPVLSDLSSARVTISFGDPDGMMLNEGVWISVGEKPLSVEMVHGATCLEKKDLLAHEVAEVADPDLYESSARRPKGLPAPAEPTLTERREHELTHLPFQSWCACLGDEYFLACTSPMRRVFTAGPLFIMMVELSAEGCGLNLADFSSTRRWTWFLSLFTSVFLRQLGTSSCPDFKLQAYFRFWPEMSDSDGHPLVKFSFSARSSIYFLLMNLWYHASRGTNFTSGVSNFCVVALRARMKHFATILRGGSNFWNRRYLDFLLKVPPTPSIVDPVELSTIHTLRSPPDFNLWDLMNF